MTQEDRNLLVQDLCGRLPYGVIVQVNDGLRGTYDRRLVQVFCDRVSCSVNVCNPLKECICIDSIKPYLRPLSSMTEEEYQEFNKIRTEHTLKCLELSDKESFELGMRFQQEELTYLYQKHYDIYGLIPKGLALETPEGMYELELLHYLLPSQNESDSVTDNDTQITVGCKIRSKTNPDEILRIVSDDCHGDEFECSNGSVLSLRQIKKHYDLYIEENKGTIVIN
jgi:hypothetical protein